MMSESGDRSDIEAGSINTPCQDEPLAAGGEGVLLEEGKIEEVEVDEDGLSLKSIEKRYERIEGVGECYVTILFPVRHGGGVDRLQRV